MIKFDEQQYLILHVSEKVVLSDELEHVGAAEAEIIW